MEPQKSTLENIKEATYHGFENLIEGADNLMNKVADKVSEVIGTNVDTEIPERREELREETR
jgi:hypothetical protein